MISHNKQLNDNYDVIVIGAGPAGCTTAALVAEKGWNTLLLEREKMPRFHVGESLMPECYWMFERLGVLDKFSKFGFTKKNGVQFVNHNDKESQPFFFPAHDPRDCSITMHVQRSEFDRIMYENATEKGATCLDETRVMDIQLNKNPPHTVKLRDIEGNESEITAKVVVDATGQQTMLANRLGIKKIDPNLKKAAIWGYFENAQRNEGDNNQSAPQVTCILHTDDKKAWFWYIPLSDGTVSVGVVSDNDSLLKNGMTPEQTFEKHREHCPGLQRRLENATRQSKYHVAKEFSYSTSQQSGDGWVLVGDAYGFIDPIYSSGVFLALKSGELAADAIHDSLESGDLSGESLGKWVEYFDGGVHWIRKLVHAFYTQEFSFGSFMKQFPHHGGNLTDLLIGRVFDGEPGRIFADMDPWIESLKTASIAE
jgi:geranylgeranyl reductase family protein